MALKLRKSFFRSIFTENCYYLYHDAEGQAAHFSTIFLNYKPVACFYRSNFSAIDNDIIKYKIDKEKLNWSFIFKQIVKKANKEYKMDVGRFCTKYQIDAIGKSNKYSFELNYELENIDLEFWWNKISEKEKSKFLKH